MAKSVIRTERIWAFGSRIDFPIYEITGVALHAEQFNSTARQKNQIVLHYTAGNGRVENALSYWNSLRNPRWICPNFNKNPPNKHEYESNAAGNCPNGHGALVDARKHASAHYLLGLAQHRQNTAQRFSDVVEAADSSHTTWHGEIVNTNSIGIEHTNVGWAFQYAADNPANGGDTMTGSGSAQRPVDGNRWLRLPAGSAVRGSRDFQAYQEEQYLAMILLLRFLCIKHRIPRAFLGDTVEEKFKKWWPGTDAMLISRLMRFRGILSHMNCHKNKSCGGPAMHRNRLFRGITDEWWLPVELDGRERGYYMGPFDPQNNQPSFFRFSGGTLQAELFRDANSEALQETRSYYDFDHEALYYAKTEVLQNGGLFPVGANKVWHGGVHFVPKQQNRHVYAAASGLIVAARLGSDATIEASNDLGSQRFVLVRHAVYTQDEADPGGGTRTNYTVDPIYVFTLYMHLAPFADLTAVNDSNPPWFNYWLRHRGASPPDPNNVFSPGVEVSVGDWLGDCGRFFNKHMLHFEVLSRTELTMAPWDSANHRAEDNDADVIANSATIDRFVRSTTGQAITELDVVRAAADLRRVKAFKKSEWALQGPDALAPVLSTASARKAHWNRIQHFMWVADAAAAFSDLATQLCDASGMMWHYHPITFMSFVNRRVQKENQQLAEPDYANTNVALSGSYITRFVKYTAGAATNEAADNAKLRPFDVSKDTYEYHFSRQDLACVGTPLPHAPAPANAAGTPETTKFHIELLDLLESIRNDFGSSITVTLSHVCAAHNVAASHSLCVLNTADALAAHAAGHAIDVHPSQRTPQKCAALWRAARQALAAHNAHYGEHAGEPSHASLPEGFSGFTISTTPAVQAKLTAGTALTAAEAGSAVFHLALAPATTRVVWECWLQRPTQATAVRLQGGNVVAVYPTKAAAEQAQASGSPAVVAEGSGFAAHIRAPSTATAVRLADGGIVTVYDSQLQAEAEKGLDNAWPRETP